MSTEVALGVAGLLVNGVGLAFVAVQVSLARRQAGNPQKEQAEERLRLKRQATLEFATATFEIRHALRSVLPDDFDAPAIISLIEECLRGEDPAGLNQILQYLGYMETFAVSISLGVHDLETADSLFGSRFIAVYENYKPFIANRRLLDHRDYFYRELEWLADALGDFRAAGLGYDAQGKYLPLAFR